MKIFRMRNSRLLNVFFILALVVGVVVTTKGLLQQTWPEVIPWVDNAFWRYLATLFVFAVALSVSARILHRNTTISAIMLGVVVALLSNTAWSLVVVCWFALASVLLGAKGKELLNIDSQVDHWSLSFVIGAGGFGTLVGILAHFPVNYVGVYAFVLLVPLVVFQREIRKVFSSILLSTNRSPNPQQLDWLEIAIAAIALTHFVVALMPEVMFDALTLHLFVPSQLASRHEWGFDPTLYAMALIPMLGDWLFSLVYMLGGETAARLLNVGFTFLLIWQGYRLVLWAGGTKRGAQWMALIFLSSPIVFTESSSLFVETVWAVFMIQAVLALVSCTDGLDGAGYRGAGLTLGFAAATKAVTLSFLPALVPIAVFYGRLRVGRRTLRSVLFGCLLFVSVGGVPYATAWIISGNPVFPFFNALFGSPFFPAVNFDNLLYHSGISWDLAFRVVFNSGDYLESSNGAGGFQWLTLLPACLVVLLWGWHKKAILLFLVACVAIMLTFHSQSYLRYVYPAVLILTVVLGTAMSKTECESTLIGKSLGYVAVSTIGLNILFLTAGTWAYRDFPIGIVFDKVNFERYLEARVPERLAVQLVNLLNIEHSPVAFFSQPFGAGLQADALYPNWYNYAFKAKVDSASGAKGVANALDDYGVNYLLLDQEWGDAEKRRSLEHVTSVIAQIGAVEVRAIRDEYRFDEERLVNPELNGAAGWTMSAGAKADASEGMFLVSVDAPAVQTVTVRGATRYLLEVTSRCGAEPSQGRVQVNWFDKENNFLDASIKVFECTPDWQSRSEIVIAPKAAKFASVYATSHTTTPIEITRISFR